MPTCENPSNSIAQQNSALRTENERLQEAKRRALAIADERAMENVTLRAALTSVEAFLRYIHATTELACGQHLTEIRTALGSEQSGEPPKETK
jgi:hypothetical protein